MNFSVFSMQETDKNAKKAVPGGDDMNVLWFGNTDHCGVSGLAGRPLRRRLFSYMRLSAMRMKSLSVSVYVGLAAKTPALARISQSQGSSRFSRSMADCRWVIRASASSLLFTIAMAMNSSPLR